MGIREENKEMVKSRESGTLYEREYKQLAEITLADVILFNRRRPREVESLKINDYETQPRDNSFEEVEASLSISEKLAVKRLRIVTVQGKCGRGVPILLNDRMTANMDILRDFNKARGLEFVFARWSTDATTPYRASLIMGDLATKDNLKHPENLRCTKLRKHLATGTRSTR